MSSSYRYDVALSFAGEQRAYVDEVAAILRSRGVAVFYDAYEQATLWGTNLYDRLADIYRNQARYVVIFASAEYAEKAWTTHERQSAQARALEEKREYVLPARFDDTEVPGIASTIAYVDLRSVSPSELAELILAKLADQDVGIALPDESPAQNSSATPAGETLGAWCDEHRPIALRGLGAIGKTHFVEVCASIDPALAVPSQRTLLDAVRASNIQTFGWPIGIVLDRDEGRPRPTAKGVVAQVSWPERGSYDYWALSNTAVFYLLKTPSEDSLDRSDAYFFNTRIVRIAETLMFLAGVYRALGAADDAVLRVRIRHTGLDSRPMSAVGDRKFSLVRDRTSIESEITTAAEVPLRDVEPRLVAVVQELLAPLFQVYEFFELADEVYEDIVQNFLAGRVT